MKLALRAAVLLIPASVLFFGAETYQKPPKEIMDILNSPTTPTLSLSPSRAYAMQGSPVRYPPIAELAEPMLRLAGVRINPKTNGLHNATFNTNLTLRKVPEGTEIKVMTPPNAKLSMPRWSPDGNHFAFTNSTQAGIELWIGDSATGHTRKLPNIRINEVMGAAGGGRGGGGAGGAVQWMADGKSLLVQMVKPNRGAPPADSPTPTGPHVQESLGGGRGARTFEDLLQTPHDEDLFEFYATSQLAVVDSVSGQVSPIGKPAIITAARMSPDGKDFIVTTIHRPFSFTYPARQFPMEIEAWDRTGKALHKLASIPLGGNGRGAAGAAAAAAAAPAAGATPADDDPTAAQPGGERTATWLPGEPATLMWFEGTGGAAGRGGRGGRGRGGAAAPAASADTTP